LLRGWSIAGCGLIGSGGRRGVGCRVRRFLAGDEGDVERIAQGEVQMRFRRNADLLAFGGGLHGSAAARANASADGRTLAASGEAADDGAESRATTDHSARAFAARFAFFLNAAGGEAIRLALVSEAIEGNGEFAGALEFARGVGSDDFQVDVETFGYDDAPVNEDRSVQ